jgi:opacity protein-like surface antigen
MKRILFYALVLVACLSGLLAAGCARQVSLADPSVKYVTLVAPYTGVPPGERTDRISIQYAVMAVARQAGYGYDWDRSFTNTNPTCRRFITPRIKNKPFRKAMSRILKPVGLTYQIEDGKVVLFRRL